MFVQAGIVRMPDRVASAKKACRVSKKNVILAVSKKRPDVKTEKIRRSYGDNPWNRFKFFI